MVGYWMLDVTLRGTMADTEKEDADRYYRDLSEHLKQFDELANMMLRAHIIVEADLDKVMRATFFYPEYITGRLQFERKAQIARAMALRTQNTQVWETMKAVNDLRNEVAHGHSLERRQARVEQLRRAVLKHLKPDMVEEYRIADDREIAIMGCALCSGFLGLLEDQLWGMRDCLNQVDEQLFPGEGGIPTRPPEDDE
jgi:hypothetical protein